MALSGSKSYTLTIGRPTLPLLLMCQNTRGPPDIKYLS